MKENLEPQFRVIIAGDGTSAVEAARTQLPDAVVPDLMMPGMNGFEVAWAIKADVLTHQIPILVLTAKNLSEADKARLSGGVSAVLQKGAVATSELLTWLRSQTIGK